MLAYIYHVKILARDFAVQVRMVGTYSKEIGEAAIVSSLGFRVSPVNFIVCIGFAFYRGGEAASFRRKTWFAGSRVSRG
jgi:hypothetical protein